LWSILIYLIWFNHVLKRLIWILALLLSLRSILVIQWILILSLLIRILFHHIHIIHVLHTWSLLLTIKLHNIRHLIFHPILLRHIVVIILLHHHILLWKCRSYHSRYLTHLSHHHILLIIHHHIIIHHHSHIHIHWSRHAISLLLDLIKFHLII